MTIEHGEHIRQLCEECINGDSPCYVFGSTPYAASIIEHIKPDGVIDDFTQATTFHGIPIVKLNNVPKSAIVISSIVDGRPVSVNALLKKSGLRYVDYFSFKNNVNFPLKDCAFVPSTLFQTDYAQHKEKYDFIYSLLADDVSRESFNRLIQFRLEEDLRVMEYFTFCPQDSYFEPFVSLSSGDVFVDVGGFDGETTREFIRHCPDYSRIHIFEPEPQQMLAIKEKLKNVRGMHFHQCGASNKKETLRFTSTGSWSHLDQNGDVEINVDTIDELVDMPVTFIKMDVEGHEYAALEGAREVIRACHPTLAICAYHRVDDFWKLPELVFSFRSDYKLYMRHYTEGVLETVYYFIPENNT